MEHDIATGVRFAGIFIFFALSVMMGVVHRGKIKSEVYEHSRRVLLWGNILLCLLSLTQFILRERTDSNTFAWAINTMFMLLVIPLYNISAVNLLRAGRRMLGYELWCAGFVVICYFVMALGFATHTLINDDAFWRTTTFWVAVAFSIEVIVLALQIILPIRKAKRTAMEQEFQEQRKVLDYTAKSMFWAAIGSIGCPWLALSYNVLANGAYCLVLFCLVLWYYVNFINYGRNMKDVLELADVMVESDMIEHETAPTEEVNKNAEETRLRIDLWLSQKRFVDPNMTITQALNQMQITAADLSLYLQNNTKVKSYRQWLPILRIAEAQRIIKKSPTVPLDIVAEMCGYANLTTFIHAFTVQAGCSPKDWQDYVTKNREHPTR